MLGTIDEVAANHGMFAWARGDMYFDGGVGGSESGELMLKEKADRRR